MKQTPLHQSQTRQTVRRKSPKRKRKNHQCDFSEFSEVWVLSSSMFLALSFSRTTYCLCNSLSCVWISIAPLCPPILFDVTQYQQKLRLVTKGVQLGLYLSHSLETSLGSCIIQIRNTPLCQVSALPLMSLNFSLSPHSLPQPLIPYSSTPDPPIFICLHPIHP